MNVNKFVLSSGDKVRETKVVMLGSSQAGKSSIVNRLIRDMFTDDLTSTVGTVFFSKTLQVDNTYVKLQIWDTGGSERYRAITPLYFHDADAAIIVYDITNDRSFQEVDLWYRALREKGPENMVIALAGNKCDLNYRAVTTNTGKMFAEKHGIPIFMETSAKSGENIYPIFTQMVSHIISDVPKGNKPGQLQPRETNTEDDEKCC
ncbi:Ras-related protein RABF2b [Tritrichomonas foetus]|uniref:Ras-related protein RABF2b n=1 Tax=Tritrichomonas foetus TaxID=1144522 RepID=A0A1J4K3W9_9EUKA|nr:Ras-related protein RABF2b [Tritrichomonas foetus]|eukprot:OHT05536.1 Ras-related protein RABF2b [Tritrichomonas foetus]